MGLLPSTCQANMCTLPSANTCTRCRLGDFLAPCRQCDGVAAPAVTWAVRHGSERYNCRAGKHAAHTHTRFGAIPMPADCCTWEKGPRCVNKLSWADRLKMQRTGYA